MAEFDSYTGSIDVSIKAERGKLWLPRFFCDDATTVYTSKAPVAKLDMPPIVFINTNLLADAGESSHATGTIDTFDLEFGGNSSISDVNDGVFSTPTRTLQYTTIGEYEATLTVTDTLGLTSQPARVKIIVIDPKDIRASRLYIATHNEGVWIYTKLAASPVAANTGLSGGDLNIASGILNPYTRFLPVENHHYWACTDNGVIYSTDGCATWNKIDTATLGNPTNTAGDTTHPTSDDLQQHAIRFDPSDDQKVYLLRSTDSTWNASNASRVYFYFSNDYGVTWNNIGIGGE